MVPRVKFCGMEMSRFLVGANPFGGYSHQNAALDNAMRSFHTTDVILDTWRRAEALGLTTFVTNNETLHVREAARQYCAAKGPMKWIAQVSFRSLPSMEEAIDEVVSFGCSAIYFHGGLMDNTYSVQGEAKAAETVARWVAHVRQAGIPCGSAAHSPVVHRWLDSLGLLDFHVVPFFNCGSLHNGGGERFHLEDIPKAIAAIQEIQKPVIAYKIMGAGRIQPKCALEHAYRNIKPGDVVNVGISRHVNDHELEDDVAMVEEILK